MDKIRTNTCTGCLKKSVMFGRVHKFKASKNPLFSPVYIGRLGQSTKGDSATIRLSPSLIYKCTLKKMHDA